MTEPLSPEQRRKLQSRMMEVFSENINTISEELQQILIDDLVTAFQNRMLVFTRIQSKRTQRGQSEEFKSVKDLY